MENRLLIMSVCCVLPLLPRGTVCEVEASSNQAVPRPVITRRLFVTANVATNFKMMRVRVRSLMLNYSHYI